LQNAPAISIDAVCRSIGAKVKISDPFDIDATRDALFDLLEEDGVKVLILKQICTLSPEKKAKKTYEVDVNEEKCLGEDCGCGRLCTRIFRCPGLIWNKEKGKAEVNEVIYIGCGVCASICPNDAINRKEVA
jgi:indolepyruvate ferredoxin oxidoreductase alpha subunit